MPELPSVTGKQALCAFEKHGFEVARIQGSHHIMKKTDHAILLTVPVHGNKDLIGDEDVVLLYLRRQAKKIKKRPAFDHCSFKGSLRVPELQTP